MNDKTVSSESKVPYVLAYGNISKALEKVKSAATPSRFTQDFLATKLGLSGGGARPVIPFFKRIGLLGSDGIPTDAYKKFRNGSESGAVAAAALRKGYTALYEINEYAHELKDSDLKGIIVQATGLEPKSSTVNAILGSFKALKSLAVFDSDEPDEVQAHKTDESPDAVQTGLPNAIDTINLGYTINLHLPATSDISVFDAIFKSLREHLLRGGKQ